MQKCFMKPRANIMGTGTYSTFFALISILALSAAEGVADPKTETVVKPAATKDLLTTLQELRHSLTNQIAALEANLKSSPADDMSVKSHLVQHYTAQKNNVEHEISLIESLERSPAATAPRHILANIGAEEKIVPSLINIFKKSPKPSNDAPSHDYSYSFSPSYPSYPSYYYPGYPAYPGYGPQFPYPYQGVPPPLKPNPSNTDNLVQSTFAGYETNNTNSQTFLTRNQLPGVSAAEARPAPPPPQPPPPSQAAPQVHLQGEVPPQPPAGALQQPPIPPAAPQNGMGIFVYYPNAVITEDDEREERPSIVDRVGQAFDRFGQVITNLASLRSASGSEGILTHGGPATRLKVHQSRPRSSSSEKAPKVSSLDESGPANGARQHQILRKSPPTKKLSEAETPDERKPKYRWTAV